MIVQDTMQYLSQLDPEVGASVQEEFARQQRNIELIASENIVSPAVMVAMGTCLTNKYAEGYPGHRYYGGCFAVDVTEELARQRACQLFGCKYANVQPHSGANANLATFFALAQPGDTILGMNLAHGGHLSHGSPVNISGKYFHIVPYVRGREKSRKPGDILAEFRGLVEAGYKEITLLGQNVNSYGKGLEEQIDFSDLLNLLCTVPGDYHIRFMTSHPKDASHKLIDTIAAQPKLCKHLHLPVQCGSDRLLQQMNRHYTVEQYLELIDYARKTVPGITFSSDIIVGFPGETEEDFVKTLELVRKVGYMQLFTFIYSKRTGTKAAEMPDPTPRKEKTDRMTRLLATQDEIAMALVKAQVGQTVRVLVEGFGRNEGTLSGRLDNNLTVEFAADPALLGSYATVHLTGARATVLLGEVEA